MSRPKGEVKKNTVIYAKLKTSLIKETHYKRWKSKRNTVQRHLNIVQTTQKEKPKLLENETT
jgi:hypothetical protein